MGSATREALAQARRALTDAGSAVGAVQAGELFDAGQALAQSVALRGVFADEARPKDQKIAVIGSLFGSRVSDETVKLLDAIVTERWSSDDDLLAGIEEIGIRAMAQTTPEGVDLSGELLAFIGTVTSNAELELALRSKRSTASAKARLVEKLLAGHASEQTVSVVRHLVTQPRGRSVRVALRQAAALVADQAGRTIATVSTAKPLASAQLDKLRSQLSVRYGRDIQINQVIDPAVVGGVRIQVGDEVIDSSVATRMNDVRLQLAG